MQASKIGKNYIFVGMVCGILVLLALVAAVVGCRPSDDQTGDTGVKDNVFVPDEFVILAWSDIIDAGTCKWKLEKMVQADFNAYLGWFDTYSEVESLLDAADEVGIKIITSSPELMTDTQRIVGLMSLHPSLYGYHIDDEPETSEFGALARRINTIRKYDDERLCYVNVYLNWAWGGENVYLSRLKSYLANVPVGFLSFDNYPIKAVNGISTLRPDWYSNLEDVRVASKKAGVPFWAFALALSHATDEANYPIPTLGELRLQQFSNLVYGAVGFQYFTTWGFIQDHGVTGVYEDIKTVNRELKSMEKMFLGADIKGVWHTGESLPSMTSALTTLPEGLSMLKTDDSGAVVSYFTNSGRNYLAVVNKNCNGEMRLEIGFDSSSARFVTKEAARVSVEASYVLSAGDIRVFEW